MPRKPGGKVGAFPGILGADQDRAIQLLPDAVGDYCRHSGELDPDAPRDLGACVNVAWKCRSCGFVVLEESFTRAAWDRLAGKRKAPR